MKKKLNKRFRLYLIYSTILLVLMLLILLFSKDILSIFVVIALILIASFSKIYKRFTGKLSFGFELVTLVTILFAYRIGIIFAIVAAIFMVIASEFISARFLMIHVMVQCLNYAVIALVVGILGDVSFIPLAIGMIIFRDTVILITGLLAGADPFKMVMATVPNVFINIFIVTKIGLFLVNLL